MIANFENKKIKAEKFILSKLKIIWFNISLSFHKFIFISCAYY